MLTPPPKKIDPYFLWMGKSRFERVETKLMGQLLWSSICVRFYVFIQSAKKASDKLKCLLIVFYDVPHRSLVLLSVCKIKFFKNSSDS